MDSNRRSMIQEDSAPLEEPSRADQLYDYSDLIRESVFIGDYPFDVLMDNIKNQFENYISTTDRTDYVDIFYDQLEDSYELARVEGEEHPNEIIEVLDEYHEKFVDTLATLIDQHLAISFNYITYVIDDARNMIDTIYDVFVLDARDNFKSIIAQKTLKMFSELPTFDFNDEVLYYKTMDDYIMNNFSPLLRSITPDEFMQTIGNEDLINMYDYDVSGNFLRKYSPRLYNNEDLLIEIKNVINLGMGSIIKQKSGGNVDGQQSAENNDIDPDKKLLF